MIITNKETIWKNSINVLRPIVSKLQLTGVVIQAFNSQTFEVKTDLYKFNAPPKRKFKARLDCYSKFQAT